MKTLGFSGRKFVQIHKLSQLTLVEEVKTNTIPQTTIETTRKISSQTFKIKRGFKTEFKSENYRITSIIVTESTATELKNQMEETG